MAEHTAPVSPTGRPEPVVILDAVKALVALLGAFGWITADEPLVQAGAGAASLLLFVALTLATRRRVTPTSDPVLQDGTSVAELVERLAAEQG